MACLQLCLVQPEFWSSLASQASQRDKFQGQHRSSTENKVDSDWIKQLKLISALAYTPNFKRIHYNYSPSLPLKGACSDYCSHTLDNRRYSDIQRFLKHRVSADEGTQRQRASFWPLHSYGNLQAEALTESWHSACRQ